MLSAITTTTTTTIVGLLYASQLVSCAVTDPKEYCGHNNATSNPVVLDESARSCVERNAFTPPELTCAFPDANFKAIYTEQTSAVITKKAARIRIREGGDPKGYANAVIYKKQSNDIGDIRIYTCMLFTQSESNKRQIEFLEFDQPTDCLMWTWTLSACKTIDRALKTLRQRGDGVRYAAPDSCRLTESVKNHYSTTHQGGSDHSVKYVNANFRLFTMATLSRSKDGKPASVTSKKGEFNSFSTRKREELLRGFTLNPNGVFAFQPILARYLCMYKEDKRLVLDVSRRVINNIATYEFSHKFSYGTFTFNVPETEFNSLSTANSDPCFGSDEKSRIIDLEKKHDVVLAVDMTKFPRSDGEEEMECTVSNENNRHTKAIVDSAKPYTTQTIAPPNEIKRAYEERRQRWTSVSANAFCIRPENKSATAGAVHGIGPGGQV
ncbi:hypothetical protein ElyMa_003964800 [Elysia marginata]|uniref:Uncharacterized protein n=1 Tax=Elysia marginata TaxID=1093978 RepID=A0AAV4FYC7_9GAST|nr:hypothetical protein ElyMa_003964800 [Elysia marginata]